MEDLAHQKCSACHKDAPRVTETEIAEFKSQIPEWEIVENEGIPHLERIYKFPDFKSAIAFTSRVGEEAEKEGHHPSLLTEPGRVKVSWWTHAINGLHRNDLIMAAKTDGISTEFPQG